MFGNIGFMKASLSGSSDMRDYDLVTDRLDITLSGASEAVVTVTNLINIDASGASTLRYQGDAVVGTSHVSGASEVVKQ
jgi:hydrogenase maturation factor HypE